jgi:UDP-N-acetylmuramoyl-L-alanyl-D-glutamate--2,6-diaminopimelate ligase
MIALAMDPHAWRLGDLLDGFADAGAVGDRQVASLTCDSRSVGPGALFLACQGARTHGLGFAEEARRRGACAILAETTSVWSAADLADLQARLGLPVIALDGLGAQVSVIADRFLGAPSARLETVGITGSVGKTSVAHALAQVLAVELPCGVIATIGRGFPGDLKATAEREPDALGLQETLESLRARGAKAVTLEISFRALGGGRAAAVHFSHAVFTGLAGADPDHADDIAASTAAAEATLGLFRCPDLIWAVLNLDDPFAETILDALPSGVCVAGFWSDSNRAGPDQALSARCDIRVFAREIESLERGLRLRVVCETPEERAEVDLDVGLIGSFNAANLLAVLAVQLSRGRHPERAALELSRIRGVPGRMECFGGEQAPLILVDEARTPATLERALSSLREHKPRRLFTVFGCGGERDPAMRPLMGAIAERLSDGLILTDDNPRGERGEAIIADILAGMADPDRVRVERQRGLAIRIAIALAGIGDAVLVAGKGHETTQDMGELKVRFSDRAQVVEALREWREGHH